MIQPQSNTSGSTGGTTGKSQGWKNLPAQRALTGSAARDTTTRNVPPPVPKKKS